MDFRVWGLLLGKTTQETPWCKAASIGAKMIDVRRLFPIEPGWPRNGMDWNRVRGVTIHHTAVDPRSSTDVALLLPASEMSGEDELNHIKIIHLYHKSKGWGGFAYHFIAFPSGRVYYVVSLRLWGAHVEGRNDLEFGLVFAGDFRGKRPGSLQFGGAHEAIDLVDDKPGRCLALSPHWLWSGTTCPGMAWPLPEQEEEVNQAEFNTMFKVAIDEVVVARQKDDGTKVDWSTLDRIINDVYKHTKEQTHEGGPSIASIADSLKITKK